MIKRYFTVITAIFSLGFFGVATAQETDPVVKEEEKKKATEQVANLGSRDRVVFDLTWLGVLHNSDKLKVKGFSRGFNFYFFYDILLGKSKKLSFAPGLGLSTQAIYTNARLNDGYIPVGDSMAIDATVIERYDEELGITDFKKNKFHQLYLDIPIELRFRGKPNEKNKRFKMAIGAKFGVLLDSHTKVKTDRTYKVKNYQDLNRIRFGPTLRIGYGSFNIVAYYGVLNLFQDGKLQDSGTLKEVKANTLSIGISINGL